MKVIVAFGVALGVNVAGADIMLTSFEDGDIFGGVKYTDTLDPLTDHALLDNVGEPLVNFVDNGNEIGFTSFYFNTRDSGGLTDGDFVGITDWTGTVAEYTDGLQGFELSDTDGAMEMTTDAFAVDAVDFTFSVDVFIAETGWEADDLIHIYVTADDSTVIDILDTTGSDIDDLLIEGEWLTYTVDLTGFATATASFLIECNSGSEEMYIDNLRLVGSGSSSPTLVVDPMPLIAGASGSFMVTDANPDESSFLAYSLQGLGSTFVPMLNVTLDLGNPQQAGSTKTSDANGDVTWNLPIPPNAAGRDVWFQAVQFELKTNVVATSVE